MDIGLFTITTCYRIQKMSKTDAKKKTCGRQELTTRHYPVLQQMVGFAPSIITKSMLLHMKFWQKANKHLEFWSNNYSGESNRMMIELDES